MTSSLDGLGRWRSFECLAALQRKRLPHVLALAARSPFYRARFSGANAPSTVADFLALDLTTKQDLRAQYPFGMLAVEHDRLATYHESSGTSGAPTSSYYTEDDWTDLRKRYARKWVGISPSDVFLVRTPYALMITGHLAQAAARSCGATVVPADSRSTAMPHARVVRVLHDLDVTLTWSNPTETLLWAAAARAAGYRPECDFPALRALFVGGEPLTPQRRRRISELWRVPVIEEYGSTETGTLAGQCPEGSLHLWSDRVLCEVFSPQTGRISPEGSGQLVVTPLYREAMPLLRYNLADEVEVSFADCACGWILPTVRVFGRSSMFAYPVGDTMVTQQQLEDLVFSLPPEREVLFWRAQAELRTLRIQIEVPEAQRATAVQELGAALNAALRIPHEIAAVAPGTLVPLPILTQDQDVLKPRGLFGPQEDWDKALLYY